MLTKDVLFDLILTHKYTKRSFDRRVAEDFGRLLRHEGLVGILETQWRQCDPEVQRRRCSNCWSRSPTVWNDTPPQKALIKAKDCNSDEF
jgi:hypothetical protein